MPIDLSLFNTEVWQEFGDVGSIKKLIKGEGSEQKVAFFKALSRRPGPTGANEYISYKLASLLDFPAAPIQLIKFGDQDGCLSLEIGNSNPWQAFPDKENAKNFFEDNTIFAKIIAFDYWVMHRDRHAGNLMFQPRENGKYQLYMIDHEHCLYSAEAAPPGNPEDFSNILKLKELAKQLGSLDELLVEARKIEQLENDTIAEIVDQFLAGAPAFLTQGQAQVIKDLLFRRKSILVSKLTECYNGVEWTQ